MATKKRPKTERDTDGAAAIAPSVRTQTEWTPTRVRSIIRQVDGGDLSQVGILCDWILTDDRVTATLGARFDALFGLEPTFDLGVGRKSKQAQKALEAGEDWWEAYPEPQLRKMAAWGLLLGLSLLRQTWVSRPDHGGRALPHLTFWHPSCLKQDQKTKKWFARDANHAEHEVTPGDGEWIFHLPAGPERPWAEGVWRCLALLVLAKSYANTDWSRTGEKAGVTVGTSDHEADNTLQHRQELASAFRDAGPGAVAILRAGFDVKRLEVTANTLQIYKAQIDMINEAIAVVIRGGNLSTVTKEGSLAGAEQQAKTSDTPKLAFDAAAVSGTIHDQSLVWWAELNFGDKRLAPWPNYPVEPEEDLRASAETSKTVLEAAAIAEGLGFEIDVREMVDRYRMEWLGKRRPPDRRAADKAAAAPPVPDDDSQDDGEGGDAAETNARKPAKAQGGFVAALASGAQMRTNRGFIEGHLYIDDLTDVATEQGQAALEPTLTAIAEAVEAASDFDDLKARLRTLYADASAEDITEIMFRAMMLADMAGRRAVTQDS